MKAMYAYYTGTGNTLGASFSRGFTERFRRYLAPGFRPGKNARNAP